MQEHDSQVVASMTVENLIDKIRFAKPDKKDLMRAGDIWSKKPHSASDREMLANKQLKAITDTEKFYRRAHAFLDKEINISLSNTIFWKCNKVEVRDYVKQKVEMVKNQHNIEKLLDNL